MYKHALEKDLKKIIIKNNKSSLKINESITNNNVYDFIN